MIFVDANIWCYYFDEKSKEHKVVVNFLDKILAENQVVMNNLIIMEIAHYLIKNLGSVKGAETIEKILEFPFIITDFGYELLLSSIEMLARYQHTGIGGRDATILATMKQMKVKDILTHDKSFKKIDFIKVIDPIANKAI